MFCNIGTVRVVCMLLKHGTKAFVIFLLNEHDDDVFG